MLKLYLRMIKADLPLCSAWRHVLHALHLGVASRSSLDFNTHRIEIAASSSMEVAMDGDPPRQIGFYQHRANTFIGSSGRDMLWSGNDTVGRPFTIWPGKG